MTLEDHLLTEGRNERSEAIDQMSPLELVELINSEDLKVVEAVRREAQSIARAIEWTAERLARGGRLIYVGAGTSGRLGVLDAAECPPTFSTPPEMVVGLIAGGSTALTRAVEGAEDDPDRGAADIAALDVGERDLVVGIASSGRTPYVLGAVREARQRGARTVGLACNTASLLAAEVELAIVPLVGAEIIAGSTRLKAGTATKMILNMISTGAMVRIGKTLGNRMVDLTPSNEKLRIRSRRMLRDLAGLDNDAAAEILARCGGNLKVALVAVLASVDPGRPRGSLMRTGVRCAPPSRPAAGASHDDGHDRKLTAAVAGNRRGRHHDPGLARRTGRARAWSRFGWPLERQGRWHGSSPKGPRSSDQRGVPRGGLLVSPGRRDLPRTGRIRSARRPPDSHRLGRPGPVGGAAHPGQRWRPRGRRGHSRRLGRRRDRGYRLDRRWPRSRRSDGARRRMGSPAR